jgi:hypothetical protein
VRHVFLACRRAQQILPLQPRGPHHRTITLPLQRAQTLPRAQLAPVDFVTRCAKTQLEQLYAFYGILQVVASRLLLASARKRAFNVIRACHHASHLLQRTAPHQLQQPTRLFPSPRRAQTQRARRRKMQRAAPRPIRAPAPRGTRAQ